MIKKALIIVDHGSKLNQANEMLAEIAELIKKRKSPEFEIISYCKPWGNITIPREIRAINKPISSFVWSNEPNICFLLFMKFINC